MPPRKALRMRTSSYLITYNHVYALAPALLSFLLSFFPSFLLSFFPSFLLFFPSSLLPFLLVTARVSTCQHKATNQRTSAQASNVRWPKHTVAPMLGSTHDPDPVPSGLLPSHYTRSAKTGRYGGNTPGDLFHRPPWPDLFHRPPWPKHA